MRQSRKSTNVKVMRQRVGGREGLVSKNIAFNKNEPNLIWYVYNTQPVLQYVNSLKQGVWELKVIRQKVEEGGGGDAGGIKGTIVNILSYLFIIFYIIFIFFFFVFWLTVHSFKLIITPIILILIDMKVIFGTCLTHTLFSFCDLYYCDMLW